MKRIFFFATPKDARNLLEEFEKKLPVKFIKYGQSETPNPPIHLHSGDIPSVGISTDETGSSSTSYLVSLRDSMNNIERFVDDQGRTRWMIHNGNNDDSVVLTMAGLWGDDILLPGNVSTLHNTKSAQQLMRSFQAALKKLDYFKIDLWWVGPEALEMLRNGKRLTTTAVQSPPEYDLPLPDELR